MTDANGAVTDRWEYSSYGTQTHHSGGSDTPFQFHGALGCMTDSNGLVYMRARTYNPRAMRFLQADPLNFAAGLNWYTAFNNNPILYVDPEGEYAWIIAGVVIGAAVDAGFEYYLQYKSGQPLNWNKIGGAAVRGAIVGGVSSIAGPAAGSAVKMFGGRATGLAAKALSGAIAAGGGATGQVANNAITGKPWNENIGSAAVAAVAGQAVGGLIRVRGLDSLSQASYFAPQQLASMVATVNARRILAGYATSGIVGWKVNEKLTTVYVADIEGVVVPRTARDVQLQIQYEDGTTYEHNFRK
jgi:RHS repeat-associated protein